MPPAPSAQPEGDPQITVGAECHPQIITREGCLPRPWGGGVLPPDHRGGGEEGGWAARELPQVPPPPGHPPGAPSGAPQVSPQVPPRCPLPQDTLQVLPLHPGGLFRRTEACLPRPSASSTWGLALPGLSLAPSPAPVLACSWLSQQAPPHSLLVWSSLFPPEHLRGGLGVLTSCPAPAPCPQERSVACCRSGPTH